MPSRLTRRNQRARRERDERRARLASPSSPSLEDLRDEIRDDLLPWYSSSAGTMRLAVHESVAWILSRYALVPLPDQPEPGYVPTRHSQEAP